MNNNDIQVLNQAQIDLQNALQSVLQSVQNTLSTVNEKAFLYAFDIKRVYDLVSEYRLQNKDPFYFNGKKYNKVEEFAKDIFGLSKSAFHAKIKVAREFCTEKGLPDVTKTKGLIFSALQDATSAEIEALERKYNALPQPKEGKKPDFSELSLKSIRALRNATNVLIEKASVVDAATVLPKDDSTEKSTEKSRNTDSTEKESGTSAREKALNAVKAYIETCADKEELKSFIAEIMAFKGNE